MRPLTPHQLQRLFPKLSPEKAEIYAPFFSDALDRGAINTRARACAFVAELGHESQDLKHLREIWGPTPAQSRYDVRVDLGNTPERDGDGKKYMGRGGLQRTGKKNYRRFEEATGIPVLDQPELLELPQHAFRSDALYWTDNKLNRLADRLTLTGDHKDLATLDKISRAINGGENGLVDRQRRYLVAIATLPPELFQEEEAKPAEVQTSALDQVSAHVNATPATPAPAEQPLADVLVAKLGKSEQAKQAGQSLLARLALRVLTPIGLLLSALQAGNRYAWIFLIVLAALAVFIIIRKRRSLGRYLRQFLKDDQ